MQYKECVRIIELPLVLMPGDEEFQYRVEIWRYRNPDGVFFSKVWQYGFYNLIPSDTDKEYFKKNGALCYILESAWGSWNCEDATPDEVFQKVIAEFELRWKREGGQFAVEEN